VPIPLPSGTNAFQLDLMITKDVNQQLLSGLTALADLQGGRRDLSGILTRAAALARDLTGVPFAYAAVGLDTTSLVCCAQDGKAVLRTDPWEGLGPLGQRAHITGGPVVWTSEAGGAIGVPDLVGGPRPSGWVGVPVRLRNPAQGLLSAASYGGHQIDEDAVHLLKVLAAHLEVVIPNLLTYQRAEALALTDELTRLYNFRFLKTALRREMERAARYGQTFSIIMIDVDHLKRYNDRYGHLQGSELLRQLAAILSRSSRAIDLVAKYGGDEFMIILPQTRLEGAVSMANRIRQAVAETVFPHCEAGDLTVSLGVASFPQHGDSVNALVAAADDACFRAKRMNRNCVVPAEPPGSPHAGRNPQPDAGRDAA